MNDAIKEFIKFEGEMLRNPDTMFATLEAGLKGRENLIWGEYIEWQKNGGKTRDLEFKDLKDTDGTYNFYWKMGNEGFAQSVSKFAPFTKEQFQKGLSAVYSFMADRPQYFKFRNLEGMWNPLQILLYKLIY